MAVYLGSRDLAGLMPIGTHQFVVMSSYSLLACKKGAPAESAGRCLGKTGGKDLYGVVVGAHNVLERLVVKYFEQSDTNAAQEYFGGRSTKWYKSDFDTEMFPVDFGAMPEGAAIQKVLFLIENYRINVSSDPIRYPTAGIGFNSNSWAQSVIQYAAGSTVQNSAGLDLSSGKRIPRIYFEPISSKRPKVN